MNSTQRLALHDALDRAINHGFHIQLTLRPVYANEQDKVNTRLADVASSVQPHDHMVTFRLCGANVLLHDSLPDAISRPDSVPNGTPAFR